MNPETMELMFPQLLSIGIGHSGICGIGIVYGGICGIHGGLCILGKTGRTNCSCASPSAGSSHMSEAAAVDALAAAIAVCLALNSRQFVA